MTHQNRLKKRATRKINIAKVTATKQHTSQNIPLPVAANREEKRTKELYVGIERRQREEIVSFGLAENEKEYSACVRIREA
jgi:hypothetical protein